jgi:hypothetical protein
MGERVCPRDIGAALTHGLLNVSEPVGVLLGTGRFFERVGYAFAHSEEEMRLPVGEDEAGHLARSCSTPLAA